MCLNVVNLIPSGLGKCLNQPFKVEITPQVLVLLCFIGVCLFLGDFYRFLAM